MLELNERVALVTGAGSGIGKASALLLAKEGTRVACLGRTRQKLQATVDEIEAAGGTGSGQAIVVVADISKPVQMQDAINQVIDAWGRLDIVVANAGINGVWAPITELEPEEFKQTIDVNLYGTFLTVKYAVPHLKKQGGAVVVTASVNGTRMFSNSGASAYASSKAAQVALAKMLALELAKHRIRVNVICPGAIETQIEDNTQQRNLAAAGEPVEFPEGKVPLTDGRPGAAEQVAQLILFLVSDASSHITGTEVWIDGAQSLLQG